jgi:hypothetical protein
MLHIVRSHNHRWALVGASKDRSVGVKSTVELAAAALVEEIFVSANVVGIVIAIVVPAVLAIFMTMRAVVSVVTATIATVVAVTEGLVMISLPRIAAPMRGLIRRLVLC